jgi:DNA-binding NtrC family response regulator
MSTNPKQVKIYRKRQSSKQPILVVDEFDIVNTITLWLDRHNFGVCGYTDPLLALEHFKDNYNKIDLVLSDIRMPQMNGYELANRIKALQPKVKVILMSAFEIREVEFSKCFIL